MTLDASGFTRGATAAAAAAKSAQGEIGKWSEANQKAAQKMERLHEEALKLNGSMRSVNDNAARTADTMRTAGSTFDHAAKSMGVTTNAAQALGPAADIASVGMQGLTKSVVGFNVASIAVAGAGFAIGTMLGNWIRQIPGVADAVDGLAQKLHFLMTGMTGKEGTAGIGAFQKEMAASHAEAVTKQVSQLKAAGVPLKEIAKQYQHITPELAKQLGIQKEQIQTLDKQRAAAERLAEQQREFSAQVKRQISDKMIEEMAGLDIWRGGGSRDRTGAGLTSTPGAKNVHFGGQWDFSKFEDETARSNVVSKTMDWSKALEDLANQLTILGTITGGVIGKLGQLAAGVAGGIGGLMAGKDRYNETKGVGGIAGLLGKVSGVGGMVAGALTIGKSIVNLFRGDPVKKAQKEAGKALGIGISREMAEAFKEESKRTGKSVSAVAKEWLDGQRKELRAQGMGEMGKGVNSLLELIGTSETITRVAAGNFATLFWETVKDEGWVAASAAFADQFEKLKAYFGDQLPPSLQGIQSLMALSQNAAVSPYLQASQAQGQFVTGAMNAGVMTGSMQTDSVAIADETLTKLRENGATDEQAYQAIGSLLQANVNAAIASGQGISADLQALLDEAKRNGVNIVADIGVQQLEVLRAIYHQLGGIASFSGGGGASVAAPGGSFPADGGGGYGAGSGGGGGEYGGRGEPIMPRNYEHAYASGGIVTKPTIGLVGEAGPEAIVPLGRGIGGLTVNATFHGDPTQTHQGRKDLSEFQYKRLLKDLRNDPLVRRYGSPGGSRSLR